MVELIAAWDHRDDEQRHLQWAQNISQALAPYALKGGYISLLDQEEQERVRLALGRTMSACSILSRNTIQMMCFDRSTSRTQFAHTVRL